VSEVEYLHERSVIVERQLDTQAEMLEKLFDRISAMEEVMLNASYAKVDDQGRLTAKIKKRSSRGNSSVARPGHPVPVDPDDPRVVAPGKRPS